MPTEVSHAAGGATAVAAPAPERPRRRLLPPAKKLLFAVHGWLGLSLGLPLFVICLSGTFAVVSHEIDWLLTPAVRAPAHDGPVNWAAIAESVQARYPRHRVTLLTAPVGRGFAAQAWVQTPDGQRRVFADPATGEVTGETGWFNTQRFFRDFHRRFFWYSAWGITLVSAFAVVLLFSVGTGLLFYKRWWAKLLTLRFHKGRRVFWSDLHRLTGVWTLLFALVIAATGVWYLVEGPATRAIELRGAEGTPSKGDVAAASKSEVIAKPLAAAGKMASESEGSGSRGARVASLGAVARPLPVGEIVRVAGEAYPGLTIRSIWFPARVGEPVRVDGQAAAWLVRDRANEVRLDAYSGEVLSVQKAEELDPAVRWIDTADPLHFGDFGGLASKLTWFGFGLLLSALMPTGVYLWLKRAEQTACGVAKRLRGETDADVAREVRRATRRRTGLGLIATTAILGWAVVTTYQALADEVPQRRSRVETPAWSIGPWTVAAFREAEEAAGEAAVYGLRFDLQSGHPNFRRAALASSDEEPGDEQWRQAGGGLDEREAKLVPTTGGSGHERLWVSIEGWDGVRHTASFTRDAFAAGGPDGGRPTAVEALGGWPVAFFYGAFSAVLIAVSAVWYRVVWFRGHKAAAGST